MQKSKPILDPQQENRVAFDTVVDVMNFLSSFFGPHIMIKKDDFEKVKILVVIHENLHCKIVSWH